MTDSAFETWWTSVRDQAGPGADPHSDARRLRTALGKEPDGTRPELLRRAIERLLRRDRAYGVVLFLLEGVTDPACLEDIAGAILPLPGPQSEAEESHLADLIRILAAAGAPGLEPPVRAYLLERPIGLHWATVPWAVWPSRPEIFAGAWCRFFGETDAAGWKNTLVIKAFLTEPDAISEVRSRLEPTSPGAWDELRKALLRQAGLVNWLSAEQREALEKALR